MKWSLSCGASECNGPCNLALTNETVFTVWNLWILGEHYLELVKEMTAAF
jgi:hypothetical protein